jgi:hypothetical protein
MLFYCNGDMCWSLAENDILEQTRCTARLTDGEVARFVEPSLIVPPGALTRRPRVMMWLGWEVTITVDYHFHR